VVRGQRIGQYSTAAPCFEQLHYSISTLDVIEAINPNKDITPLIEIFNDDIWNERQDAFQATQQTSRSSVVVVGGNTFR